MLKKMTKALLAATILAGAPLLHAQSSNRLWFVTWNGQPTPSSDVSVRSLGTDGSAAFMPAGTAVNFVSQTNFSAFNSPFDIAVDPAMGKVYVLDNNVPGTTLEHIYSFDLAGTPAQIAASGQVIYTMPVPAADVSAGTYPLLSGMALDTVNHFLYFNQIDVVTSTNSYVGRLDLTSSTNSDVHAASGGAPAFLNYYTGQIPGVGGIAIDSTNIYLAAINAASGNAGIFAAPRDGSGPVSQIVAVSTGDATFTNGFVSGVASDAQDHLIYYLTFNAGYVNGNYDLSQNALWVYDMASHSSRKISSGYAGFPDSLALDTANSRYYFTLGRNGTGSLSPTNCQAIYTGIMGTTNAPTMLYAPVLSGQDTDGNLNAGNVALQGIFIENPPALNPSSSTAAYVAGGAPMVLASAVAVTDPSSTTLNGAIVSVQDGTYAGDGDTLVANTNGTGISASYDGATETLTLSGNDTLANYQQVLRSIAFASSNSDPTEGGLHETRTMDWTVNDGGLGSISATTTLVILPEAPATNHIAMTTVASGRFLLFSGQPGQQYVIQTATAVQGPWSDLSPVLVANADGLIAYQDTEASYSATRFYRVRTIVP